MHFTLNNQETDDVSRVSKKFIFKTDFFRRLIMSVITNTLYGHPADDAQNASILHLGSLTHHRNRAYTHFLKVRKWLKWRNITPWVDANWRILQQCHTPLIIENWREKGPKIVMNLRSTHKRPFFGGRILAGNVTEIALKIRKSSLVDSFAFLLVNGNNARFST